MFENQQKEQVSQILENFVAQLQSSNQASNPQLVVQKVLLWTEGQLTLTKKLCHLILEWKTPIPSEQEALLVKEIVQTRLIDNWLEEEQEVTAPLPLRKLIYQKEVEDIARQDKGTISALNGIRLDALKKRLSLPDEQVKKIEDDVLESYRRRGKGWQQYKQAFLLATQQQGGITNRERESLERLQFILGLSDKVVAQIEGQFAPPQKTPDPSLRERLTYMLRDISGNIHRLIGGSPPVSRKPLSILELLGRAAFTGFEGGLIAIALSSFLGTILMSSGFWLWLLIILAVLVFVQFRSPIKSSYLMLIAIITFSLVILIPQLRTVIPNIGSSNPFLFILLLASVIGISLFTLNALWLLIKYFIQNYSIKG